MEVDECNEEESFEDAWEETENSPERKSPSKSNNESIINKCLELFCSTDYIMEPDVCAQIGRYFRAMGSVEQLVSLLSENYVGIAHMVNILADWLIQAGVDIKEVQNMVERHLLDMIFKNFDPKKADSIFTNSGETPAWLVEMISFQTWRNLFYQLAEEYPDCLMLNFTIKLISDAGHQGEITSVSTACHQLEVFSRVLRTFVSTFLHGGSDVFEKTLPEFNRMVCHGEHTFLYSQLVMSMLCVEAKGGCNIKRLCQEANQSAKNRGFDITPIILALNGAAKYPRACQALTSMMGRNELNPADVTALFKMYSSNDSPPVDLIRSPEFLDLFIEVLFTPKGEINPEHKHKYTYVLSYASCVVEVWKKGVRKSTNKDDLKQTITVLERGLNLCCENKGYTELLADVAIFYQCIKVPVVGKGIMRWIYNTLTQPNYFLINTEHTPIHLILLDEIATSHFLLHKEIFTILVKLFEFQFNDINDIFRLNLKKTILDRLVHLLSCGFVLPVISFVNSSFEGTSTDVSLIRHFVSEVLDMIAPPYTQEFVSAFYPLTENKSISEPLVTANKNDPISEFIKHCQNNFASL